MDKLDYYLQIYYSSLSKTLKEFGLVAEQIYSYETLKEEWKTYAKFGLGMGLSLWSIKMADPTEVPDTSELQKNLKIFKIRSGKKEEHKQIIRDLVFHMYNNDYL